MQQNTNQDAAISKAEIIKKKHLILKPLVFGIATSIILLSIYFSILTFANSFEHFTQEFKRMWYLLIPLVTGFGIQVGLYTYTKGFVKIRNITGATTSIAATGTVSTTSMVACCIHHISDVIPIIGISAASLFFTKYQAFFMIVGILSNIIGVTWMLKIIKEHNLYYKKSMIARFMQYDIKKILYGAIIFSVLASFATILTIGG